MKWIGFYTGGRHKKRRRNYRPLIVLLVLLIWLGLSCLIGLAVERFLSPDIEEPVKEVEPAPKVIEPTYLGELPVYEDILPEEALGRIPQKREILYIVIHETGNTAAGADAAAHNSFIHQNALVAEHSWHYTVDDHQIYQHLPDDEPAYHAGDHLDEGGGNLNGIAIEICVAEDNDYEKTLDNAAALAASLLLKHDLTPDDLRTHQDFSGKICPEIMIERDGFGDFAALVQEKYEGSS